MNQRKLNNKGFSLVELIVVIAIMAVLIGLLAPQFIKYVNRSKYSTDLKNAQEIATVVQTLIADGDLTGEGNDEPYDSTTAAKAAKAAATAKLMEEIPTSKTNKDNKYFVSYDKKGTVVVKLGAAAATAVTLYPKVDEEFAKNLK